MQNTTLLFLVKKERYTITDILLAKKKLGFGVGKYNEVGGKVMLNEKTEDAAIRETEEEINVKVKDLKKVAELEFVYLHKPEWNQVAHIYFCDSWIGNPTETEEMSPNWFSTNTIPLSEIWPDDAIWLPRVLAGEKLKGKFVFKNENILSHNLETTQTDSLTLCYK